MKKNTLSKIILKEKIDNLLGYFEIYPDAKKVESIQKIEKKLNTQEFKIAVVANMSAGKSTFINALFGKEVLPAFNHATTDCATYIHSKSNIEKKAIIYFDDEKDPVETTGDVEEEIKQYAQKDEECKNNKHKNVEKIELFYPFKNIQTSLGDEFKIIFIDTPGPNSTGTEYKQKHKDQTRSVLNDVDLALFMFDYAQLDANLNSDEQGLWNTIKTRHDKDESFDIYFLLNKIDSALDDNFKDIHTKDENEYIRQKQDNWNVHENKAIEKLKKAAIDHGISNPKIYPVVSKYALMRRLEEKSFDEEDEIYSFENKHFKRLFGNIWEDKLIKYLGINKIEQDIDTYINDDIKNKIFVIIDTKLSNILNEQRQSLKQKIKILEKPKQEAKHNLDNANSFLEKDADRMQEEFNTDTNAKQKEYIDTIVTIVDNNIKKQLTDKIDEATNRTIVLLELLLEGHDQKSAIKNAKNEQKENLKDYCGKNIATGLKFTVKSDIKIKKTTDAISAFMKSILNDYKNNYLDSKTDIKNNLTKLSMEIGTMFDEYKQEFDKHLKDALDIKTTNIDQNLLDTESNFGDDIKVPDSIISYNHEEAKWDEGGSFTDKKIIEEEKHSIIILPSKIKKIYTNSIKSTHRTFYNSELEKYIKVIIEFVKFYQNEVCEFKEAKEKEIEELKSDLKNKDIILTKAWIQYNELSRTQKERTWH